MLTNIDPHQEYALRLFMSTLRASGLIGCVTAALLVGCATVPPYNPFKVSREQIYAKTKTIGLVPIALPEGIPVTEDVKFKFESLIESTLMEAGFSIVPSQESAAIWKRTTEQVGGYFDPVSGKRDEEKFKTVREQTFRELKTKYNADAFLFPAIRVFKINWSGTMAYWHGTSEAIILLNLGEILFGGRKNGTVGALSLTVSIEDTNAVPLYVNYGGIQLLSKVSRSGFIPVPPKDLFIDDERNRNAVNAALGPLTKQEGPSNKPKGNQ